MRKSAFLFAIALCLLFLEAHAQRKTDLVLSYGVTEKGLVDAMNMVVGAHQHLTPSLGAKVDMRLGITYSYTLQATYLFNESKHYRGYVSAGAMHDQNIYPMVGLTNLLEVRKGLFVSLSVDASMQKTLVPSAFLGLQMKI